MQYLRIHKDGKLHRAELKSKGYPEKGRISLDFGFNNTIREELKVMADGPRFDWGKKIWSFNDSPRTRFILEYLLGNNPYAHYDQVIDYSLFTPNRPQCYQHQREMAQFCLIRKRCILAAEMGTGKTLVTIEVIEQSVKRNWWYVAPKSALVSVKVDYQKWKAKVIPRFMTYEEMTKLVTTGVETPDGIIFDESSRVKSHEAKRSKSAMHAANAVRERDGYIILMSGSPAPKSPLDWWFQCEIACPGFLREGNIHAFKERMALIKKEESTVTGQTFPKIVTFWDNDAKCKVCGKLKEHDVHSDDPFDAMVSTKAEDLHKYVASTNEVKTLYARMDGLVKVVMKEDCLDLPPKVYRIVECEPSKYVKQLAKMITKSARSAAQALIQLRELSDGFQYHEKLVGTETCGYCKGTKVYEGSPCIHCSAKGETKKYETATVEVESPKIQVVKDVLEEKEEDGRLVIFAGFSGSIDKLCDVVAKEGWKFIRIDGRGWTSSLGKDPVELLKMFQNREFDEKIAVIAHPQSGGMGLTLTASDTILYYSNDFNAESRIQSEDRIHRPGSRGANIIDIYHLPVDKLVHDNLRNKKDLQLITLGELDVIEV